MFAVVDRIGRPPSPQGAAPSSSSAAPHRLCIACRTRFAMPDVRCGGRSLCEPCYYSPAVRVCYPQVRRPYRVSCERAVRAVQPSRRGDKKYGRRGHGHRGGVKLASIPTTAAPGTPAKLAVLEARAAAGFAIFHPADARYPGDPRTLDFLARAAA